MSVELHQEEHSTMYNFENLDIYLRNFSFYHLSKVYLGTNSLFDSFKGTFLAKNLFKQIMVFGSYGRYREMIMKLVRSFITTTGDEKH
jgi:hypothetical protein